MISADDKPVLICVVGARGRGGKTSNSGHVANVTKTESLVLILETPTCRDTRGLVEGVEGEGAGRGRILLCYIWFE